MDKLITTVSSISKSISLALLRLLLQLHLKGFLEDLNRVCFSDEWLQITNSALATGYFRTLEFCLTGRRFVYRIQQTDQSAASVQGRCRTKQDGDNGYYCTEGLNLIPRHEQPTQPCLPPAERLLRYAHECEQHHQLHDLAAMPQPFRREATLLFSAGQGDNPCPRAAPAAHPLSQTTASSRAEAPGQRRASRGARPGLRQWKSTWVTNTTDSTHP